MLKDYYYLCFNCGFITRHDKWEAWGWDEEGENRIPTPPGEEAFYERCPVCQWDHWDDDSNPGIMDGSIEALTVERQRQYEDWKDRREEVELEILGAL